MQIKEERLNYIDCGGMKTIGTFVSVSAEHIEIATADNNSMFPINFFFIFNIE